MKATERFKELRDSDFTRFRKALRRDKGSDLQRDFLGKVRSGDGFLECFESIGTIGTKDAALLPERLTEPMFKEPPADTERMLYSSWSAVAPALACRSTFWAEVTLNHVRHGLIDSAFLAANGGNLSGGAERIDSALNDMTNSGPQRIDNCVRTVLRRLGGLPEVRGNRSVYVDCPFARAWWRERMIEQASAGRDDVAQSIRTVFRFSQTYWEKFIDRIVFRNSTFGSENIRSSFVRVLAGYVRDHPGSALEGSEGLQRACRRATAYQGIRELSILADDELDELMGSVVRL